MKKKQATTTKTIVWFVLFEKYEALTTHHLHKMLAAPAAVAAGSGSVLGLSLRKAINCGSSITVYFLFYLFPLLQILFYNINKPSNMCGFFSLKILFLIELSLYIFIYTKICSFNVRCCFLFICTTHTRTSRCTVFTIEHDRHKTLTTSRLQNVFIKLNSHQNWGFSKLKKKHT